MAMAGSDKTKLAHSDASAHQHIDQLKHDLEATLERYELVWQATHDILYDLDIPSGVVIWNQALYDQFGYDPQEATGTLEWWVTHIHPDDALFVEQSLSNWLNGTANNWRSEYRFRKANGKYSHVLDRGFVIRDAAGAPLRIIGTLFDITQQKELERAKDEFISLVSHQLRTPLTVIRIYGEMFAGGLLGDLTQTQAEHIGRMTDASVRLIKLVDDILQISRLELNTQNILREWIDINQAIRDDLHDVQPLADEKGITLQFKPNPQPLKAYTDREVIRQILENLLTNAIRYSHRHQGRVNVTCHQENNEVIIAVADNGIGIPKDAQQYVFDRFYRANNAMNIEEHGTGLGLHLVRVLASLMAGRVWFKSNVKTGTTFYVALPLA